MYNVHRIAAVIPIIVSRSIQYSAVVYMYKVERNQQRTLNGATRDRKTITHLNGDVNTSRFLYSS